MKEESLIDVLMRHRSEKILSDDARKYIHLWMDKEQKAEPINIRLVVKALERLTT